MIELIETQYGAVHAHVEGSSPAIGLMHGLHSDNNWQVWDSNVEATACDGSAVSALDMLGDGESGGERMDHQ
jgi:hypothetical protein